MRDETNKTGDEKMKTTNKQVIVYIDGYSKIMKLEDYNALWDIIERDGIHFDDSPFGACFAMDDTKENRHCELVLQSGGINNNFDVVNYIKRQWQKWETWEAPEEIIPAIERMRRAKDSMFVAIGVMSWQEAY